VKGTPKSSGRIKQREKENSRYVKDSTAMSFKETAKAKCLNTPCFQSIRVIKFICT
jgi:hypothetical protein